MPYAIFGTIRIHVDEKTGEALRQFSADAESFGVMSEDERTLVFQTLARAAATSIRFWEDCTIPACRRARECRGKLSAAQQVRGSGYHDLFPPCTRALESRRQQIIDAGQALSDKGEHSCARQDAPQFVRS